MKFRRPPNSSSPQELKFMFSYTSPFGGYKRSGLGREGGLDAVKEYMQTKTVWISTNPDVADPFVMR